MCDRHPDQEEGPGPGLSRRDLLLGVAGAAVLTLPGESRAASRTPAIRRRAEWAGSLAPRGPLPAELPGNTRLLEVHHSVTPGNAYTQAQVPGILREFYRMHTAKGWPDIAYNFLVDRFGVVWEGRAGSLAAPVIPSATGGHQGFSQKVCFIGDHRVSPPTAVMHDRMVSALARLAYRYGIRTAPGSTATFVSRGSNRFPRGTRVTLPTVVGHRAVSLTACPGDAAQLFVVRNYPTWVDRVVRTGS